MTNSTFNIKIKFVLLILILIICFLFSCRPSENRYCGKITELYRIGGGYKSRPEAHVVFFCDSINRKIDVEITFNTYANLYVNKEVCFDLNKFELSH